MSNHAPPVRIEPVQSEARSILATLLQDHVRELAALQHPAKGAADLTYPWLDSYWQAPERSAFFIQSGEDVAGFALINGWSVLDQPVNGTIAEFYVSPSFRRRRIGQRAACLLLAMRAGVWEVAVPAWNRPATAFWSRVLASQPTATRTDISCERWRGTVYRLSH